jgi:hypothetical protein
MKTKILLISLFTSTFTFAQSIQETINQYLKASNLETKTESINTFQVSRNYKSNTNTDYTEQISVDGIKSQYHKKKSILDRDFFYVLNGNTGFIKIPMGSRDKNPTFTTKDFSEKERVDYQSEVKDGLLPFYELSLDKPNIKRVFYFDPATGLVKKEVWIQSGITHSFLNTKYSNGEYTLPAEATYTNSKDNRAIKVTSVYSFTDPMKGLSFTK